MPVKPWDERLERRKEEADAMIARGTGRAVQTSGPRKYSRKGEPIRYGISVEEFLQSKRISTEEGANRGSRSYGEITEAATLRPGAGHEGGW